MSFFVWIVISLLTEPTLHAENPPPVLDTRGPVQNEGMKVQVDQEGVQALDYHAPPPRVKESWMAKWIGCNAPNIPDSSARYLRKEVILAQPPKNITAWINSENYLLSINGIPAARGPADAGRDFQGIGSNHRFYDCRNLTSLFHQGKNTLAVVLIGGNGFQFEAQVDFGDDHPLTLVSDESWKGISAPDLRNAEIPPDLAKKLGTHKGKHPLFDAALEPLGWQLAGFDDSKWPTCRSGTPPTDQMALNELPPLMEVRYPFFEIARVAGGVTVPDHPLTPGHPVVVKGEGEFGVHFNKIMSGRCGIAVKGCAGAQVYLTSNETNTWGGRVYQLQLRDGVQYFESKDYYALGTINVLVKNATTPVEILDVSADFLSQPVEYRGSFTCSDEALNTLWKSGRWSTQICMITHHLDSPQHQEPISDYGDYLIADLVNYNAMGTNFALARQDLRKWAWVMKNARYHTFHTSYIFYWLQSLLNYYDYTGDKSMVEELTPSVHDVLAQFTSYLGKNGIISEAPNYMFMDWVTVHDDKNPKISFACHHPPAVIGQGYMTALFYHALADGIRVSQLTNDTEHAENYETLRKQVREAYEKELWNAERGQYRDGKPFVTSAKPYNWMPADVQMESFSVQNNAFSVLYDLAPPERQPAIINTMAQNKNWDVTPYFMHFVFSSYAHAGLFGKYGVPKMHEYKVQPETQTVREMGAERGDYSHGWIASPTYQMSSQILGVAPTSPGFATLAIRPVLCGLDFARGTVPSPHGDISVDWKRPTDQFTLKVILPHGTKATIALPIDAAVNPQVTCEGKVIWSDHQAHPGLEGVLKTTQVGTTIEVEVSSGTYIVTVTGLSPQSNL